MKRLCIAVIVLSFFGFGPLKSFFANFSSGNQQIGESLMQKIKNSNHLLPLSDSSDADQEENYIFIYKDGSGTLNNRNTALIVSRNHNQKKMTLGAINIDQQTAELDISELKQSVLKEYGLNINHCFIVNTEGAAKMIDLLAPDGIKMDLGDGKGDMNPSILNGEEVISLLNQYQASPNHRGELISLVSSIKKQVEENRSIQEWITIAPSLLSEVFDSIQTDASKAELFKLGLSALTTQVNSIEPHQYVKGNQGDSREVNLDLPDDQEPIVN